MTLPASANLYCRYSYALFPQPVPAYPLGMFSAFIYRPHRLLPGLSLAIGLSLSTPSGVKAAEPSPARLAPLAKLVQDPAPQVRVEALRSLAKIPSAASAELALSVLNQPMDPTLDYALWLTINDLSEPWIAALESGAWSPSGREKQLEFALKAIKPEQASRVLTQSLAKQPLTRDGQGPWIELIGSAGSARELRSLFDQTLAGFFDASATTRTLRALGEASRLRKIQPGGALTEIGQLLNHSSSSVQVEALKLAAQWKQLGSHFPKLGELAGSTSSSPEVRAEALNTLRAIGGAGALDTLTALTASSQPTVLRQSAVSALAALDLGRAVPVVMDLVRSLKDEGTALDLWRAILPVKGAGKALVASLPVSGIDPAVARAGMRAAREGGRNDLDLVTALAKAAGLATDSQEFNLQLVKDLASKSATAGDPDRGEFIYRRADLACVSCHAIGGAGSKVGPDLTSIGASAPHDYLVDSLIFPNSKIKEGYHSLEVTTKDGSEFIGTLARETPQELLLRNAAGAEVAIAKTDIIKREQGTTSLMPAGLLEPLTEQEQLDLFAFLSRLGKPGEFDASKGGVARRWYLANLVHTDVQNGEADWAWRKPLADKRWVGLSSRVNGRLTRPLMEAATKTQIWTGKLAVFAATEIQVGQAGKVRFLLECPPGPELWIDGRKVGTAGPSSVELSQGVHRVVLQIPPQHVPEALRLTSPDVSFVLN